jgi:hypothetical protein
MHRSLSEIKTVATAVVAAAAAAINAYTHQKVLPAAATECAALLRTVGGRAQLYR